MGNITFGSFIAEKRKAHKFNLRDTAKHLNIAYGYLCDIEQSRRPAPNGDFVERISAFLNLDKSEHELLLDLAAKSRNTVSADSRFSTIIPITATLVSILIPLPQ